MAEAKIRGAGQIGVKVGKVIDRQEVAKHFRIEISDTSLHVSRKLELSPPRPAPAPGFARSTAA